MSPRPVRLLAALFVICVSSAFAQTPPFDLKTYQSFLAAHQDLSAEQLLALHPAGVFAKHAPTSFMSTLYVDSITAKYNLTPYEQSLIEQNSFMVSERLTSPSPATAFLDIYQKDLPVFVSTDAILHAWHMSYDEILKSVETSLLMQRLDTLLASLYGQLPARAAAYTNKPAMQQMLRDMDVYLTVPRRLLGSTDGPYFAENMTAVSQLLGLVAGQQPAAIALFQSAVRIIDFSQFTPRGHYTQTPELTRYFQAMIWLGRMELTILPPVQDDIPPTEADLQRQAIDAVLLHEGALGCDGYAKLDKLDRIIRFFVGESDNITLPQIQAMVGETNLSDASALLDTLIFRDFCTVLGQKSYAYQRINSQILWSNPVSPEQLKPAGAFLLLGQRFVIDSYVTGSVVYDKIMYQGRKFWRALPSTLDVLYALGNDASAQLLEPELEQYHYGSNLAAVRYLVDSYEPAFWAGTLYNGWLRAIRALNPPASRTTMPGFMQTAAWWQEKMNTQLASWAQLRHDNLLYAKQSYTGGAGCSYPETFVEPVPEFYDALKSTADSAAAGFRSPLFNDSYIAGFFENMGRILDTLATVARKELTKTPLSTVEKDFLRHVLFSVSAGCTIGFDGWYTRLYWTRDRGFMKEDRVVADVHTCPTDGAGNLVGWVLHAGTGPVNMAVVAATLPDGRSMAFIGPVLSYYEHVTTNFKRFTDEEWKTAYAVSPSFRPPLVNIYLADATGNSRGSGPSLVSGVDVDPTPGALPMSVTLEQNYPNPFNGQTIITFSIPAALTGSPVDLVIYDVQGRRLRTLLHQNMPAGTFLARWNGDRDDGSSVATGVYFYRLRSGAQMRSGRMMLIR